MTDSSARRAPALEATDTVSESRRPLKVNGLVAKSAKEDVVASSAVERPSIVQVEAAKLRLVTDKRLGKKSPNWLQRVAQGLPPQNVQTAG
jgi:hypothetical protein